MNQQWRVTTHGNTVRVQNHDKRSTWAIDTFAGYIELSWRVKDDCKLQQQTIWRVCSILKLMDDVVTSAMALEYHRADTRQWPWIIRDCTVCNDDKLAATQLGTKSARVEYCSDNLLLGRSPTIIDIKAPKTHITHNVRLPALQIQVFTPLGSVTLCYTLPTNQNPHFYLENGNFRMMDRESATIWTYDWAVDCIVIKLPLLCQCLGWH